LTDSYAVVAVRDFRSSKLRLKEVLNEDQRSRLTQALLRRVIVSLQGSNLKRIVIVCSKPEEVVLMFESSEKLSVIRESTHRGGVNGAMLDGIRYMNSKTQGLLLLLPADLPLITSRSIDEVLNMLSDFDMVICPSLREDGTNLLGFRTAKIIPLHYDSNSYVNHVREAEVQGLKFKSIEKQEISFDLDDPRDLGELMPRLGVSEFEELLKKLTS
jgi:2-phospho-L-lactate/phosphoenolpyruvate guanylyltransferase